MASRKVDQDSATVDVTRPTRIDEGGVSDDISDKDVPPGRKSAMATENLRAVPSDRLMNKVSDIVEAEPLIASQGMKASPDSRGSNVDDVANNTNSRAPDKVSASNPGILVFKLTRMGTTKSWRQQSSSPKLHRG